MTSYNIIGFDIRYKEFPTLSADLNIWERDDDFYDKLIKDLGFSENIFQLLNLSKDELFSLKKELEYRNDLCCISISIPKLIYSIYSKLDSRLSLNTNDYLSKSFFFDVCDLDGFFSFFDIQKTLTKSDFDIMSMENKLEVLQYSNFLVKEHSPFSIIKAELIDFTV